MASMQAQMKVEASGVVGSINQFMSEFPATMNFNKAIWDKSETGVLEETVGEESLTMSPQDHV